MAPARGVVRPPPWAIAGGNPFPNSLTRWDSGNTRSVFRPITGMSGAAWINKGGVKPTVEIQTEGVLVKSEELAGIPLLSDRMIRDSAGTSGPTTRRPNRRTMPRATSPVRVEWSITYGRA
ncbi:hypothetical protein GCM10009789_54030 [Kribbella sancticallisti]|uniref:Uncharacterized protein n=1 Tax=Kribbella sancticallisti TaxID=460087 RepID=A0ABP4PW88_9ACTN